MSVDTVFVSFYTDDPYYTEAATRLEQDLIRQGHTPHFYKFEPDHRDWLSTTRAKFKFLNNASRLFPSARLIWIDADTRILRVPPEATTFTTDFMGMHRIQNLLEGTYGRYTRYWRPDFWGINLSNPKGRKFLQDLVALEESSREISATDDWILEEVWRRHCNSISFTALPLAEIVVEQNRFDRVSPRGGIIQGHSGNVKIFKGKAVQHRTPKSLQPKFIRRLKSFVRPLAKLGAIDPTLHPPVVDAMRSRPLQKLARKQLGLITDGRASKSLTTFLTIFKPFQSTESAEASFYEKVSSIHLYSQSGAGANIRLAWWQTPYPGNFGDSLSPFILSEISGRPLTPTRLGGIGQKKTAHILSTGSIAKFAQSTSVVWGSGFSQEGQLAAMDAEWISVRGPLSEEIVRQQGGQPSHPSGDPGLLLRRIVEVDSKLREHKIAYVPHYAHQNHSFPVASGFNFLDVRVFSPENIRQFVTALQSHELVVTTAMHVAIACVSFGVPFVLGKFSDGPQIAGDGMKYRDFSLAAGLDSLDLVDFSETDSESDLSRLAVEFRVDDSVLDGITLAAKAAISSFDSRSTI